MLGITISLPQVFADIELAKKQVDYDLNRIDAEIVSGKLYPASATLGTLSQRCRDIMQRIEQIRLVFESIGSVKQDKALNNLYKPIDTALIKSKLQLELVLEFTAWLYVRCQRLRKSEKKLARNLTENIQFLFRSKFLDTKRGVLHIRYVDQGLNTRTKLFLYRQRLIQPSGSERSYKLLTLESEKGLQISNYKKDYWQNAPYVKDGSGSLICVTSGYPSYFIGSVKPIMMFTLLDIFQDVISDQHKMLIKV